MKAHKWWFVKRHALICCTVQNVIRSLTLGNRKSALEVKVQLSEIGKELETIQMKGSIDDIEQFLEEKGKVREQCEATSKDYVVSPFVYALLGQFSGLPTSLSDIFPHSMFHILSRSLTSFCHMAGVTEDLQHDSKSPCFLYFTSAILFIGAGPSP